MSLLFSLSKVQCCKKNSCLGHTLKQLPGPSPIQLVPQVLLCFKQDLHIIISNSNKRLTFYNAYLVYRRSMLFLTLLWTLPLFSNEICWQPKSKALIYMNFQAKFCQQVINRILCVTLLLKAQKTTPLWAYLIRLRSLGVYLESFRFFTVG